MDIVARLMGCNKDIDVKVASEAASEILLLRHELRQLQRDIDIDAKRYRWLRNQNVTMWQLGVAYIATGYGLDQTCDQGMQHDR
ncbi:MAG: hypothetical protein RLZ64_2029 [Pseudomonadota bacterium]